MQTKGSRPIHQIRSERPIDQTRRHDRIPAYLCAALALLAVVSILATWALPRQDGDLFVALAGGRDVAAGHLGQPDDWSCLTAGRIWINQNWLSHLLIYLAWKTGGPTGLLLLKAALLTATATLLFLLSLRRGTSWPVAVLLAAGLTMACSQFVQLRANLLTLVMVPLLMWLLHRGIDDRRRVWWALPVVLAWANLHGGFVFGLGMIWLWAFCITAQDWYRRTPSALGGNWHLWACAAACIAAAAVSPFGLGNLTHPLVIASSKIWREIPDWLPLLQSPFGTPWMFFVVLGLTAGLALLRLLCWLFDRPASHGAANAGPTPIGPFVFDSLLSVLVIIMAFRSLRFISLVALVLAAPLASLLAWLVRRFGRRAAAALAAGVLLELVPLARQDVLVYWPSNPTFRGTSIFDRMHRLPETFPVLAGRFLAENHLGGNVLCEWEWEGYLRWVCPDLKPVIGGRAQQVFSEEDLAAYYRLFDPRVGPDWLRQKQVSLAVLRPGDSNGQTMVSVLIGSNGWTCVYCDDETMVLVDSQAEDRLVQQCLASRLVYPSEPIRVLSQTLCLATQSSGSPPTDILAAAMQANAALPAVQAYIVVGCLGASPALRSDVIQYLQEEADRLLQLPSNPDNRLSILRCRMTIESTLIGLYQQAGQPRDAQLAASARLELDQELDSIWATWK